MQVGHNWHCNSIGQSVTDHKNLLEKFGSEIY